MVSFIGLICSWIHDEESDTTVVFSQSSSSLAALTRTPDEKE
jgi:hypothetical protein